jgi:hypothetical protein
MVKLLLYLARARLICAGRLMERPYQLKQNHALLEQFRQLTAQMKHRTNTLTAQFQDSPSELDAAALVLVERFQHTIDVLERVVAPGVVETISDHQFQTLRPLMPSFIRRIQTALVVCDQFIDRQLSIVEFSERFAPLAARSA